MDPKAHIRLVVCEGVGVLAGLFACTSLLSALFLGADGSGLSMLGLFVGPPVGLLLGWLLGRRKERWVWALAGVPGGAIFGGALGGLFFYTLGEDILHLSQALGGLLGKAGFLIGGAAGAVAGSFLGPVAGERDKTYIRLVVCETVGTLVGLIACFSILSAVGKMLLGPRGGALGMLGLVIGPPVGYFLGQFFGRLLAGRKESWVWALAALPIGAILGSLTLPTIGAATLHLSAGLTDLLDLAGFLMGGAASGAAVGWFLRREPAGRNPS